MEEDIRQAVAALRQGQIILYPTDTIWGLGCDATNPDAVSRLFDIKRRDDSKSMLILLDSVNLLERYADVPEIAYSMIEVADRPLTLIYPNGRNMASALLAADGSVGIRITREPFTMRLIQRFGRPIVSTSANLSGAPSPATFAEISPDIVDAADYVVQYRRDDTAPATPSSVIKLGSGGLFEIIRP
ncbi:MAG: threonylcarbamoyl-AMP synthase [Bacteroidales bacterium]|jgi:L-threonylcarbamoyladenylate synthase|nr:threonylcarbamoyl-AMP synthase [Bacteroidales bacterium]